MSGQPDQVFAALAAAPDPAQLLADTDQSVPSAPIAADDENVFYGDGASLKKVPVGGGDVVSLYSGPAGSHVVAVTADAERLYFLVDRDFLDGYVLSIPRSGGAVEEVSAAAPSAGLQVAPVADQLHVARDPARGDLR